MSFYLKSEKPVEILQHGVLHAGSLALPEDETEQYSEDSGHTLHIVIGLGGPLPLAVQGLPLPATLPAVQFHKKSTLGEDRGVSRVVKTGPLSTMKHTNHKKCHGNASTACDDNLQGHDADPGALLPAAAGHGHASGKP